MPKTVIMIVAIIALAAGAAQADREFTFNQHNSFDAPAISMIKIDMPRGEIAVVKSSGQTIEVQYKNLIYAQDQAEADDINKDYIYKAEQSGNTLNIKIEPPRHPRHKKGIINRIINNDWEDGNYPLLKVSVPDGKAFEISSASADIEVTELQIDLDIETASSDIFIENTSGKFDCNLASGDVSIVGHRGPVFIKGVSSDIDLSDIEGDVNATTASGDVEIDKVKGDARITSTSGDNRAYDIDGDLDSETTSGDTEINGVSGSVRVESISGDIRLGALSATEGYFDVEAISGDISMEVSRDFTGQVELSTVSGTINSRLSVDLDRYSDSQVSAKVGDGKGKLNVATTSGDISIDRY